MTTEERLNRAEEIIAMTMAVIQLSGEFYNYEFIVNRLESDVAPLIDKYRADLIREKQTVDSSTELEEKSGA